MENFTHEFFEAGVRAVEGPLEVTHKASKLGAEQFPLLKFFGKRGIKRFVALRTEVTETAVFGEVNQFFRKLSRVLNPRFGFVVWTKRAMAIRAFRKAILFDLVDLFGFEETAPESRMAFLAAGFPGG